MTEEEIKKAEKLENIEILEDVDGDVINLDTNEEINAMGKGEEDGEE